MDLRVHDVTHGTRRVFEDEVRRALAASGSGVAILTDTSREELAP